MAQTLETLTREQAQFKLQQLFWLIDQLLDERGVAKQIARPYRTMVTKGMFTPQVKACGSVLYYAIKDASYVTFDYMLDGDRGWFDVLGFKDKELEARWNALLAKHEADKQAIMNA